MEPILGEGGEEPLATVLVVDDDEDVRNLLAFKLRRAGFTVHAEADGEAGLAAVARERPDLVVLDWVMPHLTGPEVCRRLRGDQELSETRIVMLTSRADEPDLQRGLAAGADDYVIKPVSPPDLIDRVRAALEAERPE